VSGRSHSPEGAGHFQPASDGGKDRYEMGRIHLLAFMMFAVLAFSAFFAASALAAETLLAEWLLEALPIVSDLVETEGELLLENLANGGAVLCSGILDGFVEANGFDLVTEVLTLGPTPRKVVLGGEGVKCLGEGNCVAEEDAEAWPEKLPWLTELILFEAEFHNLVYNPAWFVLCLAIVILTVQEEECVVEHHTSSTKLTNVAEGVEGEFPAEADEELAKCKGEAEKLGMLTGSGVTLPVGGGTLTVSSE
jgi:hypothetical protein